MRPSHNLKLEYFLAHTLILSQINLYIGGENIDPLEQIFGKTAQMTVLKNLVEHPNEPTYISGIARETGLSNSIVSKVLTPLVMSGIIVEKPLGKLRTFRVDPESKAANLIIDFFKEINQIFDENGKLL